MEGELPIGYVAKAVEKLEWKISTPRLERMLQDADLDGSGSIDFGEFLFLMRQIDMEIRKDDEDPVLAKRMKRKRTQLLVEQRERSKSRKHTGRSMKLPPVVEQPTRSTSPRSTSSGEEGATEKKLAA